jgi:predicted metalloprotease with PDZ domain
VYEGLTQYLGFVLAARSGLWSPEQYRDAFAADAARLDSEAGRSWRPLADTAAGAQLLYEARNDWRDYRRGVDFYDEGNLIWLEIDVTIRGSPRDTGRSTISARPSSARPPGRPR